MKNSVFFLLAIFFLASCDTTKLSKTSDDLFVGVWSISGETILDGVEVEITKDANGNFAGHITKLNEDKLVQMFMAEGDKLITGVKRLSNFEFELSEKKIASKLFAEYDQSTTVKYKVEFEDSDRIVVMETGAKKVFVRVK